MYSILTEQHYGLEINHIILRREDGSMVSMRENPADIDYQKFLDEVNDKGIDIVEGNIPESILSNAAERKFNQQLSAYKVAVSRLSQYIISEGRSEFKEMIPSGEQRFNEQTGEMEDVLVEMVTQTAIDPLPATVIITNVDGTTEEIRNPAIVQDEEERAAAQATVDATPEEVKAAA